MNWDILDLVEDKASDSEKEFTHHNFTRMERGLPLVVPLSESMVEIYDWLLNKNDTRYIEPYFANKTYLFFISKGKLFSFIETNNIHLLNHGEFNKFCDEYENPEEFLSDFEIPYAYDVDKGYVISLWTGNRVRIEEVK